MYMGGREGHAVKFVTLFRKSVDKGGFRQYDAPSLIGQRRFFRLLGAVVSQDASRFCCL